MEKQPVVPKGILLPFALLCTLFFAWAVPNNLTDTMLATFKRIMSLSDSKTAWIQIACYFCGYGCFALPGALFIKRFTYKSGVLLGLGLYAGGAILIYPVGLAAGISLDLCYMLYLVCLVILFAGLSVLETSTNSYVCAIGSEHTATQRLNFAQSFNPFGAITGVVVSTIFVLSQLNTKTAEDRALLAPEELTKIQTGEINAVTAAYLVMGLLMVCLFLAIFFTKMPKLKEDDKSLDLIGTFGRLFRNVNYISGVAAQFCYVGAQIAVWSYIIQYTMAQLDFDAVVKSLGPDATKAQIIGALRNVEPCAATFYNVCEWLRLDFVLPKTAEHAGGTYYIMSLVLFAAARFACTGLMNFFKPRNLLAALSVLAFVCCMITIYNVELFGGILGKNASFIGVYALMIISACMSLMFPTIYGLGIAGLKDDTKIGGSGMVMAIAGAAVLTQIQGMLSDWLGGDIKMAYWVPAIAFVLIAIYGLVICRIYEKTHDVDMG
ncbi:MAG: L-fucose:H+ symporter permease [Pirellulales bacterium]|nr:L-fucose:H+ symporter permease [Pirellulales bacterium]